MIGESAKVAASRARVVLLPLLGVALCSLAVPAPSLASSSPTIESVSVSGVTEHDVTLEAQINTQGSYTGYWFQIDTNSSYDFTQADCPFEFPDDAECDSIAVGEPLPAGLVEPHPEYIQAGLGEQSVRLDLASIGATLQPSTTYHYRVLASSGGNPTVVYPDQTFENPWKIVDAPRANRALAGQSADRERIRRTPTVGPRSRRPAGRSTHSSRSERRRVAQAKVPDDRPKARRGLEGLQERAEAPAGKLQKAGGEEVRRRRQGKPAEVISRSAARRAGAGSSSGPGPRRFSFRRLWGISGHSTQAR